jgi:hypothetical protein
MKRGKTKILVSGDVFVDAPMTTTGVAVCPYKGEFDVDLDPQVPS